MEDRREKRTASRPPRAPSANAPAVRRQAGLAQGGSLSSLLRSVLEHLADQDASSCIVLSGGIGAGKTQRAEGLAQALVAHGVSVGGVLAPRVLSDGETIGYRIRDLLTGEERPFASQYPPGIRVGRFHMNEEGLRFGLAAIERGAREARVVFVDEVGRWELAGGGFAPAIRALLASQALPVLLVRDTLVEEALQVFGIGRSEVLSVAEAPEEAR
jgi:nucleoside-triphosphatase THEP1